MKSFSGSKKSLIYCSCRDLFLHSLDSITDSVDMSLSKHQETGRQRSLCRSPRGDKESDMTQQLNNNKIS